jgi:hypothetical protein
MLELTGLAERVRSRTVPAPGDQAAAMEKLPGNPDP